MHASEQNAHFLTHKKNLQNVWRQNNFVPFCARKAENIKMCEKFGIAKICIKIYQKWHQISKNQLFEAQNLYKIRKSGFCNEISDPIRH